MPNNFIQLLVGYIVTTFSCNAVLVGEHRIGVGKCSPSSRLVRVEGKERPHNYPYLCIDLPQSYVILRANEIMPSGMS